MAIGEFAEFGKTRNNFFGMYKQFGIDTLQFHQAFEQTMKQLNQSIKNAFEYFTSLWMERWRSIFLSGK